MLTWLDVSANVFFGSDLRINFLSLSYGMSHKGLGVCVVFTRLWRASLKYCSDIFTVMCARRFVLTISRSFYTFYTRDHSIMSFLCIFRHVADYVWHVTLELDCFALALKKVFTGTQVVEIYMFYFFKFSLEFKNFLSSNMRTVKFLKWSDIPAWTWISEVFP